ncbi:MAG: glycoside hydrolase family 28 protein [Phycisphaerae bacterium]
MALSRREWLTLAAPLVGAAALPSCSSSTFPPARLPFASATPLALGARTYNVRDFGAAGDGKTLDTKHIQAAINQCAQDNGGIVLLPAGKFLVGTLELKTNVTLRLAADATLLGSTNRDDYDKPAKLPPGNGNCVLLFAANADNVTIEGPGKIDGQGAAFFTGHGDATGPGEGGRARTQPSMRNVDRPHLAVFYKCTNLHLRNVFLTRSAYHCCRILSCRFVQLDGVRIFNRVNLNNDGFHFNDTEFAAVLNCNIECQDDACALFGSCRFITVANSSFSTRWSVFRFGGGNAENITVSNCLIYDTYGCPIKMAGGRGRFENISFANLVMKNVTGPITVNLNSRGGRNGFASATQPATAPAATQPARGVVRNISFANIQATVLYQPPPRTDMPIGKIWPGEQRQCIVINGASPDDVLENISIADVHATFIGGGTLDEARREIPPVGGEYFQIGTPPAYGIYARNVRGLTINNVRLDTQTPDRRPAVVMDRVADAQVAGLAVQGNLNADAALRLRDCRDVVVRSPRMLSAARVFARIEGPQTAGVIIGGGDVSRAAKPLETLAGVPEGAVHLQA